MWRAPPYLQSSCSLPARAQVKGDREEAGSKADGRYDSSSLLPTTGGGSPVLMFAGIWSALHLKCLQGQTNTCCIFLLRKRACLGASSLIISSPSRTCVLFLLGFWQGQPLALAVVVQQRVSSPLSADKGLLLSVSFVDTCLLTI